jgi:hypothetical protein
LQNDVVIFSGTYSENDIEYDMRATFALDKMMEIYEIQRADEIATESSDIEGIREAEETEDTEKNKTPGKKLLLSGAGQCNYTNKCDIDEIAMVTKGGVSIAEVNPKSMESKMLPGLFFAVMTKN